jgi:hypothetical protein
MAKAPPEAPATYFRLSDETWAIIVEEYANGATAKQLGAKWKVAPNSVYRHVGAAKMTKRDCGDQRARAHAKAVSLATKARDAKLGPRPETIEPALTTLFTPAPADDPDAADPAALANAATLASGRAMKGRLWVEAKALAGLAETYARLESRAVADRRSGMTIETVDLKLLAEILMHPSPDARLAVWADGPETPDYGIRKAYTEYKCAMLREAGAQRDARYHYVRRLVDIIHDLGGKAPEPPDRANLGMRIGDGVSAEDDEVGR